MFSLNMFDDEKEKKKKKKRKKKVKNEVEYTVPRAEDSFSGSGIDFFRNLGVLRG